MYELGKKKKTSLSSKRHTLCMCTKDLRTEGETRTLTRGASHLVPSDLVLVLHCGSGPYSDFMAKIWGVNTAVCNMPPYFPHYSLGFKSHTSHALHGSTVVLSLPTWMETGDQFPWWAYFINNHSWNGFGRCQKFCQYYFACLSAFLVVFLSRSELRRPDFIHDLIQVECQKQCRIKSKLQIYICHLFF